MIGPASLSPVLITKSRALLTGFWSFSTISRIFWPMPPRPITLARKPMMIGTIWPRTSSILFDDAADVAADDVGDRVEDGVDELRRSGWRC